MKRMGAVLVLASFLIVGCGGPAFSGFAAGSADSASSATLSRYRESEITEYQGARLDPAIGPDDNSIKGVQQVDIAEFTLTLDGLVDNVTVLTYDDVLALPPYERLVTLHCVTGWDATILWKGVLLQDLIALAGTKTGAATVIFSSVDGYTTSLPLDTILQKQLILGYGANGLPLPPEMGYPFIVIAEDKLGYKWGRWINRITLSDDANYKGYWEQRGYSNEAEIPVP